MISEAGDHFEVSGPMTLASARGLEEAGARLLTRSENRVDLGAVTDLDSSALAVVFAWMRSAKGRGGRVVIQHAPPNLRSLADLYGVTELLPLA